MQHIIIYFCDIIFRIVARNIYTIVKHIFYSILINKLGYMLLIHYICGIIVVCGVLFIVPGIRTERTNEILVSPQRAAAFAV